MPKVFKLSSSELTWLRENKDKPPKELAARIGCCVDTMKRILTREGIKEYHAPKYVPAFKPPTWRRPCLICKDDRPRPRWQYICDACKERNAEG